MLVRVGNGADRNRPKRGKGSNMARRSTVQRHNDTLRLMLAQHASEGRNPTLEAITTIYNNLLVGNAGSDTWLLFTQVASLPLVVRHFVPSCVADDGYYTFGGKWVHGPCSKVPHCSHRNVEQTKTITLEAPRDMVAEGRMFQARLVAGWWGKQLADALATR